MAKRAMALIFVLILSLNIWTGAAIVSDNDGSAFVTKAEFEAMKKSFAEQVNNYENSITNKIDGAIASYLAGIKVSKEPDDLYENVKTALGSDLVFLKGTKETKSDNKPELNITCNNRYFVESNDLTDPDYEVWNSGSCYDATDTTKRYAQYGFQKGVPGVGATEANIYYWQYCFASSADVILRSDQTAGSGGLHGVLQQVDFSDDSSTDIGAWIWTSDSYNPTKKLKGTSISSITQTGEGKVYTFTDNGTYKVLDEYASSFWPMLRGTATFHTYRNCKATNRTNYKSWHQADNGMGMRGTGYDQTANTGTRTGWGTISWKRSASDDTGEEAKNITYFGSATYAICKNTDSFDYSIYQWGTGTDVSIYAVNTNVAPTISSTKTEYSITGSTFESSYYQTANLNKTTQTNNLPNNKLEYYKPSITPTAYTLNSFVNSYLTAVAGENVYIGGGCPVFKTADSDQSVKVTFKVESTGGTSSNVKVLFSDKQFVNGAVAADGTLLKEFDCTPGTVYTHKFELEKDNQIVWVNMYDTDTTNNYNSNFTSFKIKLA